MLPSLLGTNAEHLKTITVARADKTGEKVEVIILGDAELLQIDMC